MDVALTGWTVLLEMRLEDSQLEPAAACLLEVARVFDPNARRKTIESAALQRALRPDRAFPEVRVDSPGQKPRANGRGLHGRRIA
jgi:hypothetical protein